MAQAITQRELRNDSGEIMRSLDQGESFIVTRNGTPVRSVSATVDDFGSADGESTVTLGPITYQTTTTRGTAGVLTALAVTGPAGRRLETGLGYAPGDLSASSRTINGEPVESATPKPIAATGGCK